MNGAILASAGRRVMRLLIFPNVMVYGVIVFVGAATQNKALTLAVAVASYPLAILIGRKIWKD